MQQLQQEMVEREQIANRKKHWVRAVTACNSRCLFCLDMDTPRNVFLPFDEVCADLQRGIDELNADKVIISGGEASLHPKFFELIQHAKSIGYDRVQTVTNGWQYANREFYHKSIDAGLGEITFSLHGHTPELHDRLTQHHGSFKRLMKALIRAVRDPKGPIVNVDVVINKQNVPHLDKIIELCISVGVREFDLLHVIPQSEAYRNRELLFYDVRDHIDVLHKVFRLNRHPGFVIWTNRFPVSYLEGLEDLIQDPHKMLDEVHGRRYQVRRYLDTGEPLDCREKDRCVHCFIEPFCTTMDRFVEQQNKQQFEVWSVGEAYTDALPEPMPFGCSRVGITLQSIEELAQVPFSHPLEIALQELAPLPNIDRDIRWIVDSVEQLELWIDAIPEGHQLEIRLLRSMIPWLLQNRERLLQKLDQIVIYQPSYEKMQEALNNDVRSPAEFFQQLQLPIRVRGLSPCLAPNTILLEPVARLDSSLFINGRVDVRPLSKRHIEHGYFSKSSRCQDCSLDSHCDGIHINMIRDQGLKLAQPLMDTGWGAEARKQLEARGEKLRIAKGCAPQPVAASLSGFAPPGEPPRDPLAVLGEEVKAKRAERRAARQRRLKGE